MVSLYSIGPYVTLDSIQSHHDNSIASKADSPLSSPPNHVILLHFQWYIYREINGSHKDEERNDRDMCIDGQVKKYLSR